MMKSLPRGIRNHNPGNIERGDPWQGLAEDQSGDSRFAVFAAPEWGIRALARVLITYQDRHGLRSVRGIIGRWAPSVENDTGAYVGAVARALGVGPDQALDLHDYATLRPLVEAIIHHENGQQPYPASLINEGLRLAGVEPPANAVREALDAERPLGRTRTVQGGRAAEAAGGVALVSGAVAAIGPAVPVLRDVAALVRDNAAGVLIAVGLAVVASVGWMIYARWDDRRRGRR